MKTVTKNVVEYVQNVEGRGNVFTCMHTKDHCGRILLPLDAAVAAIKDDSGQYEVLVLGQLSTIDDWNQRALWEPDDNFKDFGFVKEWVGADKLVRFPTAKMGLANELRSFFSAINVAGLANKEIYKNGVRLRIG